MRKGADRVIVGLSGRKKLSSPEALSERMNQAQIRQAHQKKQEHDAYMDQIVACPACKQEGKIKKLAVMKSNGIKGRSGRGWIDHLVCKSCKVHFGPPDGEVQLTGDDWYWLRRSA